MLNLNDGLKVFLKALIDQAVHGTFNSIEKQLRDGPSGRIKDPNKLKNQEWYLGLRDDEKKILLNIIQDVINRTVFNLLVIIDNKLVGYPLQKEISDFALYLQTYENQNDLTNYKPKEILRINRSYSINGDLHDEFTAYINGDKI
jgi:hypothetical protein